jgi:hypothetical protein
MMKKQRFLRFLVVAALVAVPAVAQEEVHSMEMPELAVAAASPSCGAGVVYDDNNLENGYSIGNGDPGDSTMVTKFDLPAGTTGLDQVCACFSRSASGPPNMSFQVVVYDDNGAGGQPGTLLGTAGATATNLAPTGAFYGVSLAGSGINLPDNSIYIGVRWPGGANFFLCGDSSATTAQRTNYASPDQGASWTNVGTLFPAAPPRTLGIRVDPLAATAACIPSATAMCLNNNRFRVEASFRTATGSSQQAQVVKLTNETGYFTFFDPSNVEVVVKVLNGCGVNSRYWVFAAGLTNVEVILRVTDTVTGIQQTYLNPLNRPFPPLQDTNAFATCP